MQSEIEVFWPMLNSEDFQVQEKGFQKWTEFVQNHPCYFESIKKHLTKHFCEVYQKMRFHDFHVQDIEYHSNPPKMTEVRLFIYDYHEDHSKNLYFTITYRNVSKYSINVESTQYAISWGYDIFEILENGLLKHRILCSDRTSIEIVFKTINIVKSKPSVTSE